MGGGERESKAANACLFLLQRKRYTVVIFSRLCNYLAPQVCMAPYITDRAENHSLQSELRGQWEEQEMRKSYRVSIILAFTIIRVKCCLKYKGRLNAFNLMERSWLKYEVDQGLTYSFKNYAATKLLPVICNSQEAEMLQLDFFQLPQLLSVGSGFVYTKPWHFPGRMSFPIQYLQPQHPYKPCPHIEDYGTAVAGPLRNLKGCMGECKVDTQLQGRTGHSLLDTTDSSKMVSVNTSMDALRTETLRL